MQFDLRSYLFEPITAAKAYLIGYDILTSIGKYDSRIQISGVTVSPNIQNDSYGITLSIYIPELEKNISLKSVLNQDGYYTA